MSRLDPPWVALANGELVVKEIPGKGSNERIEEYFKACGATAEWALKQENTDAIPWCGAFVGWLMAQCGYPLAPEPLRARSWLEWGDKVDKPYPGVIVVLRRGADPKAGHVGILHQISDDGKTLYILGGNQGDAVSIGAFPVTSLLGYRVPPGYKLPGVMDLVKDSRIAKGARDLLTVGGAGGATKVIEVATEPPKEIGETLSEWQSFGEQALSFAHFVGRNFTFIMILAIIFISVRILYARWEDQRKGKTGGM